MFVTKLSMEKIWLDELRLQFKSVARIAVEGRKEGGGGEKKIGLTELQNRENRTKTNYYA